MKYTKSQVKAIGEELRTRFMNNQADGTEIVIALVSMYKADRIDEQDLKRILLDVHMGNTEGVLRTLAGASLMIDQSLIEEILKELRQ